MSPHNPERVQTWREWIETGERSGQTIHAFCRDRNRTRYHFDRWRRILSAGPRGVEAVPGGDVRADDARRGPASRGRAPDRCDSPRAAHDRLKTAAVLLSVCARATRHWLNPWAYLCDVLDQLAARSATADVTDLLPDTWASCRAQTT